MWIISTISISPTLQAAATALGRATTLDEPVPAFLVADESPRRAPPPSTSTSHPGELQRRGSDNSKKPSSHVAEGFCFRATCRSALHHGSVYDAVTHLDADAFAAELAGDFPR